MKSSCEQIYAEKMDVGDSICYMTWKSHYISSHTMLDTRFDLVVKIIFVSGGVHLESNSERDRCLCGWNFRSTVGSSSPYSWYYNYLGVS